MSPKTIVGDSIVWWRMWILWPRSPARYIGPVIITATLGTFLALKWSNIANNWGVQHLVLPVTSNGQSTGSQPDTMWRISTMYWLQYHRLSQTLLQSHSLHIEHGVTIHIFQGRNIDKEYFCRRHKQCLSQTSSVENSSHALRVLTLLVGAGSVYNTVCVSESF